MQITESAFVSVTANGASSFATALSFGLRQLAGTDGCVSSSVAETACTLLTNGQMGGPRSIVVSPDDKHVYVGSYNNDGLVAFSRNASTGALAQLAGTAGCITEPVVSPCATGRALDGAYTVAISPDGNNLYVTAHLAGAGGPDPGGGVAILTRTPTTGALSQAASTAGCITDNGDAKAKNACTVGTAIVHPIGVTVSPDGKNVYVASWGSNAVTVFDRNTGTGALTQKTGLSACVSENGTSGACTDGRALVGAYMVAVSPDGAHVYVASREGDSVAIFTRNATTGALTQSAAVDGCIANTGASGCTDVNALDGPTDVIVSPDGAHVYFSAGSPGSNSVTVFSRNATTGALTQAPGTAGCWSATGDGGTCSIDASLSGTLQLAISPDGKDVYVPSPSNSTLSVYTRDAATGRVTHTAGTGGCFSPTGNGGLCTVANGITNNFAAVVAPDGKDLYVTGDSTASVAVFTRNR